MDADPRLGVSLVNHPDHRAVGQALDITVTGGTTASIFPELVLDEGRSRGGAWRRSG